MTATFRANTSEVKYRTLFESIDEGFCIIEVIFDQQDKPVDYRFLEINPSFERQTGLASVRGRTIRQLVPQHEQHWFDIYGRIALTGEPARFEQRAEQLGRRCYDVYAWRHGLPEERQVAVLFNDVTVRKDAEEALLRSQQELSDFFDNATVGMHWVGPDGTILRVNQAELDLLGYSRDEYVGRHIAEFHVDRPVIDGILARLARGEGIHECPARLRHRDGSVRDTLINSSALFENGRFIHTRCFMRDITERKRAEQAQGKLAAIVENSHDAIVSKNLDGIITSWNRAAVQLFGYTAQEAIGRPVTMLMPPDRVDEEPGILKRIREGLRIEHYETVRRRKDGTAVDISLTVSPILDEHGTIVGASKIARDISERKRAEESLRDSDRRKEEFLAMLSHELRNPLAPMRHAVTLLQQADEGEIRRQACAILDRQVEHMTRLVEELLDISRISRGSIEVHKREVDLATIVETAVETSRPLVEAAGHQLEVTLPHAPINIVADEHRLAQVVSNLLNNAAKYTPRGGRIGLNISTAPDAAAISVRDNGIGIAADDLPRLFNMFTQINGARRYSPDGMGVGLALARRLVELHGGTIEARSDGPGRGSEFTVRLPLLAADRRGASS